jgi:hypothetical protein
MSAAAAVAESCAGSGDKRLGEWSIAFSFEAVTGARYYYRSTGDSSCCVYQFIRVDDVMKSPKLAD